MSYHYHMKSFEDIIEVICEDERTYSIPILYIVQVIIVVMESFRLEKKNELSLSEQSILTESNVTTAAGSGES